MLTMADIVRDGAPILRTKTKIVDPIDDETVEQLKSMRQYLVNSQNPKTSEEYGLRPGVGLAAPQIGLDKRMLAIYVDDEDGNAEYDYMLTNLRVKNNKQYLVNSLNPKTSKEYGLRPGVGLAAPQIGLDKRMLAIYVEDEDDNAKYDYMLINPKVKSHSVTETYLPNGEGCLSVDE